MSIYAVGMLAFTVFTSILSLYLGMDFGFTEKTVGYVFLYVGALAVVMRSLCLGAIVDRVGEAWAMRLGAFSLAAGLLLYPLPGNFWALAAIMPLVPVGTALLLALAAFPAFAAPPEKGKEDDAAIVADLKQKLQTKVTVDYKEMRLVEIAIRKRGIGELSPFVGLALGDRHS